MSFEIMQKKGLAHLLGTFPRKKGGQKKYTMKKGGSPAYDLD